MTGDLPAPLTPQDCDLRGYEFLPLYGHRLFSSDFNARVSDAAFRAAVCLWWQAWQQCPAASLPDDDAVLCHLAGFGRGVKAWRKVRTEALHGFVLCSDGRLYHAALAPLALDAWGKRRDARDRKRRQREREKPDEDCPSSVPRDGDVTARGQAKDVTQQGRGEDRRVKERRGEVLRTPAHETREPAGFAAWWAEYPRKTGKDAGRKAYAAALGRGASEADLITGLRRAVFDTREAGRFIPHPATWLNGGRWQDEPPEPGPPERPKFRNAAAKIVFEEMERAATQQDDDGEALARLPGHRLQIEERGR